MTRSATIGGILAVTALLAGCGAETPDAFGNFEATEVTVSAELQGRLLSFSAREGERLAAGAVVGQIDTTALALQREELASRRGTAELRSTEADAQMRVLRAQLTTAQETYQRTRRLYRAEAATAQQLNETEGAVRVLNARIQAARAGSEAARTQTAGAEAQIAEIGERIRKGTIVNPSAGTVLTTFVEPGEFVQPGMPLYRIAPLDTLELRVYVSESQLAGLRLGQQAEIHLDGSGGERTTLSGRVVWIASEAEFTPTPIQTRDERTSQVYAVKIRLPNPSGAAKIGMPADVDFTPDPAR